jgi:flavin reductase (DIM6/NTAB) family NADH-FMN oxidoreductase RutF
MEFGYFTLSDNHYGGDHIIVIGVVERYGYDPDAAPLVFHRGRYASLAAAG